jgi:hypothetical protein
VSTLGCTGLGWPPEKLLEFLAGVSPFRPLGRWTDHPVQLFRRQERPFSGIFVLGHSVWVLSARVLAPFLEHVGCQTRGRDGTVWAAEGRPFPEAAHGALKACATTEGVNLLLGSGFCFYGRGLQFLRGAGDGFGGAQVAPVIGVGAMTHYPLSLTCETQIGLDDGERALFAQHL